MQIAIDTPPPPVIRYHVWKRVHWADQCRDMMAERLARRAEDQEVPGSSPTQD